MMMKTTTVFFEKLKNEIPALVLAQIPAIPALTTVTRAAHFLSQCSHESNNFISLAENLNYSSAGLLRTFPKYFTGGGSSKAYAHKPSAIGNKIYAARLGNGNEYSGDGYRYRGRGCIQITGKDNYAAFSQFINADCVADPDLIASDYPLQSAAWFFYVNNLWTICDRGATDLVVETLTRRINGGDNGLADRIKLFRRFYQLLVAPTKT
jgi:putative chitinase